MPNDHDGAPKPAMTIGLLNERLFHDYPIGVLAGASRYAQRHNINLISLNGGAFQHKRVYHRASNFLFDVGHAPMFDGLVIVMSQVGTFLSEAEQKEAAERFAPRPVVAIGNPIEGIPTIGVDNYGGMYSAIDHLVVTHHHSKIVFVKGTEGNIESRIREAAYRDCLTNHGIDVDPDLLIQGDYTYESGLEVAQELLVGRGLQPGTDFTAVAVANDEMLRGVMELLDSEGHHIPDEIACVGFDNSRASVSSIPAITTVHQHHEELGETAMAVVTAMIRGESVAENTLVESELVIRDSCGCGYARAAETDVPAVDSEPGATAEGPEAALAAGRLKFQQADVEDLKKSLIGAVNGDDRLYFRKLRYFLRRVAIRSDRTGALKTFLKRLGEWANTEAPGNGDRLSYLLTESRIMLGDHLSAIAETAFLTAVEEFYKLRRAGFSVLATPDSRHFSTELLGSLYWLGISYCAIVLFDTQETGSPRLRIPKTGRTLLAYSRADGGTRNDDETVPTMELFPGGEKPPEPYVVIVEPLYFLEEPLGYMVISNELENAVGYDHLSASISATLKDAQVTEALRQANVELSETNRRLTKAMEEMDLARHRLLESEKLASLGQLVAGIAHEINTPLGNSITLGSHLSSQISRLKTTAGSFSDEQLDRSVSDVSESHELLMRNIARASELVASFKTVSAGQTGDRIEEFDLRAFVDDVLMSHRQQMKRHVVTVRAPESIIIRSYPGVFSQILGNLINNSAIHAFGDGRKGNVSIDIERNDGRLLIRYRDDGEGMTEEVSRRVFEPFFTTKFGEGGSGMGMYIVYSLVTGRLAGEVTCTSSPGAGVDVKIDVPENAPDDRDTRSAADYHP